MVLFLHRIVFVLIALCWICGFLVDAFIIPLYEGVVKSGLRNMFRAGRYCMVIIWSNLGRGVWGKEKETLKKLVEFENQEDRSRASVPEWWWGRAWIVANLYYWWSRKTFRVSESSPVEYPPSRSWIFIANLVRNELFYQSLSFWFML
jgi:hypothetical protein